MDGSKSGFPELPPFNENPPFVGRTFLTAIAETLRPIALEWIVEEYFDIAMVQGIEVNLSVSCLTDRVLLVCLVKD
jgi:hypothetical protein